MAKWIQAKKSALTQEQIERIEQHAEEWAERMKECSDHGHRGPLVEPLPYCPSNQGRQSVMVMCKNCFGSYERALNEAEQKQLRDFYESLREPFTI